MDIHSIELVPLTNEEYFLLMSVYKKRRVILIKSFIAFIPVMMFFSVYAMEYATWPYNNGDSWYLKSAAYYYARRYVYMQNFFVGMGIFSVIATYINVVRVNTLKKDADSGMKQRIAYAIERKQYLPLTNQYFLWLIKSDNPSYEVDEATYNNCKEGDLFYIYMAAKSKFVFEHSGKYEVI